MEEEIPQFISAHIVLTEVTHITSLNKKYGKEKIKTIGKGRQGQVSLAGIE